jgi:methionyl-tRNA formyltransferase
MRAVFFGTPQIAVPALQALAEIATITAVVCQPDRPAGRGLKLAAPPVKEAARALGIAVVQPLKLRTGEFAAWLAAEQADVAVVLAYGRILPRDVLAAPRRGAMNLHASLLPKYRGAAPINWAIVRGETETGVSLMQMDEGLDTGPVYSRHVIPIGEHENAGSLSERIAVLAAEVLRKDLLNAVSGELAAEPQDEAEATLAPLIEREHLRVDFSKPARAIVNLVRGMAPRPGAFTTVNGKTLRLFEVKRCEGEAKAARPGTVALFGRRALVSTGDGVLELLVAQLPGKKALPACDLINGRVLENGSVLGA